MQTTCRIRDPLECAEIQRLNSHERGVLPTRDDQRRIFDHLDVCRSCFEIEMAWYRSFEAALGDLTNETVDPACRVMQAIAFDERIPEGDPQLDGPFAHIEHCAACQRMDRFAMFLAQFERRARKRKQNVS